MDRRRGGSVRPANSEEVECWSHATGSLKKLNSIYINQATDLVSKINRCIAAWPSDETLPAEGLVAVQNIYKKLIAGLDELSQRTDNETKAIDDAIEKLGVLIALRKAPTEALPQDTKRAKRRLSPGHSGSTPVPEGLPPKPVPKIVLPARNATPTTPAPMLPSSGTDSKTRKIRYKDQLPYHVGRKVAYHIKASTNAPTNDDSAEWILAIIHDCISGDKNRYIVRDADDGHTYPTTTKSIIPLPDPEAKPGSYEALDRYPKFPPQSVVMALYPDTTSFYRAEVVEGMRPLPAPKGPLHYTLRFDDDGENKHDVLAHLVVEWPKA